MLVLDLILLVIIIKLTFSNYPWDLHVIVHLDQLVAPTVLQGKNRQLVIEEKHPC